MKPELKNNGGIKMLKKKISLSIIALYVVLNIFLVSCSKDSSTTEPNIIDISGNWELWVEYEGEIEEPSYNIITQSGNDITIVEYYSTGDNVIQGTINNNDIMFSFTNEDSITTNVNGTVNSEGNIISGIWNDSNGESGTWSGEKIYQVPIPWCVDINYYKFYGSNSYEPGPNFPYESDGIWDMQESDWCYIGQGNSTNEFEVTTSYSWVMITWSGKTSYYFDAITDEVANVPFGSGGYTWVTKGLDNYLINTENSEPSNFKGNPDGIYVITTKIGFSAMTFPSSDSSISIDPVSGKGKIKIFMTLNP
ncbi:MAG: hypothetical protein H8D45_12365 [Bacteroidetes bacterium]|nr:hypothetical protein [Bacteroidota bacterium]